MAHYPAYARKQMTPPRFLKPCLDCGVLSRGYRCPTHESEANKKYRKPMSPEREAKKRLLYNSDYRRRAAVVRANATQCHLCGGGPREGDPWQADHLYPGNPESPLLPAHRSCNLRKGGKSPL